MPHISQLTTAENITYRSSVSSLEQAGASEFAYYDNYLIDSHSCVIAGVMATPARLSQEIVAARQMLERAKERFGLQPVSVTADKSYGTGEFLSWLSDRQIAPYIPCWIGNNRRMASIRSMSSLQCRKRRRTAAQQASCCAIQE